MWGIQMKQKTKVAVGIGILIIYMLSMISFASAVIVNANFITIFPGEEGKITIEVDNNENFDIEDVSVSLILAEIPFTVVGSSEKSIDDLDEDDDDRATFTIRASSDIVPGDYSIPYLLEYTNSDDDESFEKEGTFGIRVSAKTDIDFTAEVNENAIVGEQGRITLEVVNKGLGDIKSVSVQIFPSGFELLSKDEIFIGTVNPDDTDIATFDVFYRSSNPTLSATIEYKDFDNQDQIQTVSIPLKVYTREEALELGLISQSSTGIYIGLGIALAIAWIIYRRVKKKRKNKQQGKVENDKKKY